MKEIITLILFVCITGCCDEPIFLKTGFTKETKSVIDITLRINNDSINNRIIDTVSITEKYYNEKNKIISRIQQTLFDNGRMEIDYLYSESNRLQKEIIKLHFDTSTVDYVYQDTMIYKASTHTIKSDFEFRQITNYKYSKANLLSEIAMSQLYVDKESGDTSLNSLIVDTYNKKERIEKSLTINYLDTTKNKMSLFNYKCGRLTGINEYNSKDSLTLKTKLKYIYDSDGNWIERKTINNGDLKYIVKRQIEYR